MEFITTHHMIEAVGWLAVLFKLATFSMNSMIWLRVLVILSSVCFIIYSAVFQIWPLLAIEVILLASGSEVQHALAAAEQIGAGARVGRPVPTTVRRGGSG